MADNPKITCDGGAAGCASWKSGRPAAVKSCCAAGAPASAGAGAVLEEEAACVDDNTLDTVLEEEVCTVGADDAVATIECELPAGGRAGSNSWAVDIAGMTGLT